MPRRSNVLATLVIASCVGVGMTLPGLIAPAQAVQRRAAEHAIAVCATPLLLNDLMESDRFKPERERFAQEKTVDLEPMIKEIQELQGRLQQITQEDPEFPQLFQRFQQLRQQIQARQTEINAELESFTAKQVVEAYKLVRSSAQAIAADLGFDYVISTGQEDEEFNTTVVDATLRQIMARPVIMSPEGADITEDVREDLNLE